jgi:hypothetical protein
MTKESFRFVKNFENYMISDCGRVFSIRRNKFLKLRITNSGYYYVNLCNNNIVKNFSIHRLVAQAF